MKTLTVELPAELLARLQAVADEDAAGDLSPVLAEILEWALDQDEPAIPGSWRGPASRE